MKRPEFYGKTSGFPAAALEVLGWTTPSELAFVHEYLRDHYTGLGAVVELGCAFGRSTVALAAGLGAQPRVRDRRLQVFDRFELDWFLHRELERAGQAGDLREGDRFEAVFWQSLAPWRERIEIHPGDVASGAWEGGPIEFLFVDVLKSWETAAGVIRTFYPALVPGAIVVQQDYKHPFAPQVILTQHRLRDHFEPAWDIGGDGSASVAFRVVRPFSAAEIESALGAGLCELASYSIGEIEQAFAAARELAAASPELERSRLAAARVVLFGDLLGEDPESVAAAASLGEPIQLWLAGRLGPLVAQPDTAVSRALVESNAELAACRSVLHQVQHSRSGRLLWAWWRWRNRKVSPAGAPKLPAG